MNRKLKIFAFLLLLVCATCANAQNSPARPAFAGFPGTCADPIHQTGCLAPLVTPSSPIPAGYTLTKVCAAGPPTCTWATFTAALAGVTCSEVVQLDHTAIFTGASSGNEFVYPNLTCAAGTWPIFEPDDPQNLPPPGVRINPLYESAMPQIQANGTAVASLLDIPDGGFGGVEFWGLRFDVNSSLGNFDSLTFVLCGTGSSTVAGLSSGFLFNQIIMEGSDSPISDTKHGFGVNCNQFGLTNSWVWHIHENGFDGQTAYIGNETGPGIIDNNFLSAAGEVILVGGVNLLFGAPNEPSDWTITRNQYNLPLTYRIEWGNAMTSAVRDATGTYATYTAAANGVTPHPGDTVFIPTGSMTDSTFDQNSGCTILSSPVPTFTTFSCNDSGTANATASGISLSVSAGSWTSGTATLTVGTNNLAIGSVVNVLGITPGGYSPGPVVITGATSTTISYALTNNPGTYVSGGAVTSRWWEEDPSYAFRQYPNQWAAKNVSEMKYGQRFLYEGNVFCCSWPPGQSGRAVTANGTGTGVATSWTTLTDLTYIYNGFFGWNAGMFEPADQNGITPTLGMHRVYFGNNEGYGGNGDAGFYILNAGGSGPAICPNCDSSPNPFSDVQEVHNTWVTGSNQVVAPSTAVENAGGVGVGQSQFPNFVYRDNLLNYKSVNGLIETGCKIGVTSTACTTASNYSKNLFYNTVTANCSTAPAWGSSAAACPVTSLAAVNFTDPTNNNYRLLPSSLGFQAATDGFDVGVDVLELNRQLYGVFSGQWPTHRVISHGSIRGGSVH